MLKGFTKHLPFRDEMEVWPDVAALLDARLGPGRWRPLSPPRPLQRQLYAGVPIGGACKLQIERVGDSPLCPVFAEAVLIVLPPVSVPVLPQEGAQQDTTGPCAHRALSCPVCVVCGEPATSRYPARAKKAPDGLSWWRWYACRKHTQLVKHAPIGEAGALLLNQEVH